MRKQQPRTAEGTRRLNNGDLQHKGRILKDPDAGVDGEGRSRSRLKLGLYLRGSIKSPPLLAHQFPKVVPGNITPWILAGFALEYFECLK